MKRYSRIVGSSVASEAERWQLIEGQREEIRASAYILSARTLLSSASDKSLSSHKLTVVKTGDTIQALARKHGVSERELIRLNNLTTPPFIDSSTRSLRSGMLVLGQPIRIPVTQQLRALSSPTDILFATNRQDREYGADLQSTADEWKDVRFAGASESEQLNWSDDLIWISGPDCVLQTLRLRIKRVAGDSFDFPGDGMPEVGGRSSDLDLRARRALIVGAILLDPRIQNVNKCELTYKEGATWVTIEVTLRGGSIVGDTVAV